MSEVPYLRIWTWERPWYFLCLVGRWQEMEVYPPPDATFADVVRMADELRARGAEVQVVQE